MGENIQKMNDMVFSFAEPGFQEFETSKYLVGILKQNGFTVQEGVAGIPTAFVARWGSGKPVIALGLGHRRHPAGVAEARRRVARADRRGRAGARRRTQRRDAAADRRGARREEGDGAAASAGHADAVAGRRRGARRLKGVLRPRRPVQGRGHLDLRARRRQPRCQLGRQREPDRPGLGAVQLHGRERPRRRGALARQVGARRGRADGHRLELPARTSPAPAALALRHPQRRRSAQRRPAQRLRLVLLPRGHLSGHQTDVGDRRQDGAGRDDDDRHPGHQYRPRFGVARPLQQDHRRSDARQHRQGRPAAVVRGRPGAGACAAARAEGAGGRPGDQDPAAAWPRGDPGRGEARRRLRRHRRHLVERADGRPALSVEHGGGARPQLGQRDFDGDADRAQGHSSRRQSGRADGDRLPDEARAHDAGVGLLPQRADQDHRSTCR